MTSVPESAKPVADGRPLKILYVAACFLPHLGGTEIHTAEVARRMVAMGHDVTVIAADGPAGEVTVDHGVKVIRVQGYPRRSDLHFAPNLVRQIRQWEGDIVHVQGYHTFVAPLALAVALSKGLPTILTFHSGGHSSRFRRSIRPLQRQLLRPLLRRTSHLVGVSTFETTFFSRTLKIPLDKFTMVPNGTELDLSVVEHDVPDDAPTRPTIASVGRLERYKGHHLAIASLPELRKTMPDVLLKIIGRGPFEKELREQVDRLGVQGNVEFAWFPADDRNGLARAMARADVVVLLSEYESQGMTILEGMALGRPVLVASTSALGPLADSHQAHSIPIDAGPVALAAKLHSILNAEAQLECSESKIYRWDDIADKLLTVYREALSGRPVS